MNLSPVRFLDLVTRLPRRTLSLAAAVLVMSACASGATGQFEWADAYLARTPGASDATYLIGVGDLLSVQVFDNEKMSARGRVRSDGRIAIPLLNDIDVAGKSPTAAANDVAAALKKADLVLNPRVNIVVEEVLPVRVTVLGAVKGSGNFSIERGSGVAEALAVAGGLTDFAHKDRIYVIRKLPQPMRLRFTFSSLTDLSRAGGFRLQQGDILVVE